MFLLLCSMLDPTPNPELPIRVDGVLCNPGRLMVQISSPSGEQSIIQAGYQIIGRATPLGYVTVRVPLGEVASARSVLRGRPGVSRVELDHAKQLAYTPNDPLWPNQWHMRAIKADLAWDLGFGIPVTVAVIDTGLDVTHPDLAANVWINEHEIPGNGIDDDGNGYIDDINGYDFANDDPTLEDPLAHGTSCAGIVGAVQDNGIGVTGVAPRAKLMGLKATNNSGFLYDSYLVPAYMYAAAMGVKVISMSYFSDRVSHAERLALDYCWSVGALPVAASGNDNTIYPYYPAAYEKVLSVAALNTSLQKASFSDYGTWVDVAAPGVSLTTTRPGGTYTNGFGGTSGACPHVAGLAALIMGSRPGITNVLARQIIEDTATPVIQEPLGEYANYGLVDAHAAMAAALGSLPPRKPGVVRYITPAAREAREPLYLGGRTPPTRIYGRGFQPPANVSVKFRGSNVRIVERTRDYVDIDLPNSTGSLVITIDGRLAGSMTVNATNKITYGAVEAGTKDANLYHGTFARLYGVGGGVATCTTRSDGRIYVQSTFRRVTPYPAAATNGSQLVIRRRYTGTVGGTENVYLYDWSTGSFPYGNFVLVRSGAVPKSMTTHTINLTNLPRFIDFEGTVYAFIETTGVDATGQLELDQLNLAKPR